MSRERRRFTAELKAQIVRRHLSGKEPVSILDYHDRHPLEGYRRLMFMRLDDDVVVILPGVGPHLDRVYADAAEGAAYVLARLRERGSAKAAERGF